MFCLLNTISINSFFQALVHVSSAYVNSVLTEVDEQVYPAPYDVNELIALVEKLDIETLKQETPSILKDHPNSYTFTKHLAEHEVKNGGIPAAIVRPSMSMYITCKNISIFQKNYIL